jgi:glutathione reductase (NADPH)
VEVSQWYRGSQILRGFDEEARNLVAEEMREKGVDLVTGANAASLEKTDSGLLVKGTHGVDETFDVVMFATGRRPLTDNLGLEAAGVATGSSGQISVDKFSRTGIENIYAVGDVTKRVELTPVAIREAMAFVETVFNDNPTAVDHELIPSAIFTQPEMGTVGLSEEDAAMQEPIEVYCTSFRPMQTAFANGEGKVLMKLVVSKETRVVLGCHIVSPHAGELIQLAGIAVKMGATKEQFDQTCAVHPTMSEELVTMKTPVRST